MNDIPIFDSLTHPTLNGIWMGKNNNNNTINNLKKQMKENNVKWALAVGMKEISDYDESNYAEIIRKNSNTLYPIAFFDFNKLANVSIEFYLKELKRKGYVGIKIHPRISKIPLCDNQLEKVVKISNDIGLSVLLCTYFYDENSRLRDNNIYKLEELLCKIKYDKVILLHGGISRLLEMREMASIYKNVLIDLSFTICRYKGSSLDFDIKYLFESFDQRICIGSDSPQFSIDKLRERFNFFADGISVAKLENIAYKNLFDFIGGI